MKPTFSCTRPPAGGSLAGRPNPSAPSHISAVATYYDHTWFDYRGFWLNPDNRSIHFCYWDSSTKNHSESLLNMNRVLARQVQLRPGERVLDAGCGVGGTAMWLAREHGARVIGITPVASQVARACLYASERGLGRLCQFAQQDYLYMGFADRSFDVVWALESVCHAPDKKAFLREAYRVLKPGGRMIAAEYFRCGRPYPPRDEALLSSWLSGWAIPDLATGTEFAGWAAEIGFKDCRLEDIYPPVRSSLRRLFLLAISLYPVATAFYALGWRSRIEQGNIRGARDQWRGLKRGLWFYGVLTGRKA